MVGTCIIECKQEHTETYNGANQTIGIGVVRHDKKVFGQT